MHAFLRSVVDGGTEWTDALSLSRSAVNGRQRKRRTRIGISLIFSLIPQYAQKPVVNFWKRKSGPTNQKPTLPRCVFMRSGA
jgi:hypothetical protein